VPEELRDDFIHAERCRDFMGDCSSISRKEHQSLDPRYHLCMGLFHIGCKVVNPRTGKSVVVTRMMVDTGAESTWIDSLVLAKAGIEPRKKDLQSQMANGQIITRSVGYAVLKVDKAETVDEVVFAQKGDLQLLGARALEGLNLRVDSRRKKLVAAGPIVAAAAVPPRFGELIRVPIQETKRRRKLSKPAAKKPRGIRKSKTAS
jgi:predicted aspartyl protease